MSLFDTPPAKRPEEDDLEAICDHFGISLEMGELFRRVHECWSDEPFNHWSATKIEDLYEAVNSYKLHGPAGSEI